MAIGLLKQFRTVQDIDLAGTLVLGHVIYPMPAGVTTEFRMGFHVPQGVRLEAGYEPRIQASGFTQAAGTAGQGYRFEFGMEYSADGEVVSGIDDETVTFTQGAHLGADTLVEGFEKLLDLSKIAESDHVNCIFRRLGGDPADDRPGDFRFLHLMLMWARWQDSVST